jgi:hypothetical protein
LKYKYFSLTDGKLSSISIVKEPNYYSALTYSYQHNVVLAINDNKKTFDSVACYKNETIPLPYLYAEGSIFYEPFSNERIVEIALGGCGAKEDTIKKSEELKGKEDIQLLLNLGKKFN